MALDEQGLMAAIRRAFPLELPDIDAAPARGVSRLPGNMPTSITGIVSYSLAMPPIPSTR